MKKSTIILLITILFLQTGSCIARMSGAGAGLLGGGLGFMAGTMVASSAARNNSYNSEPQVVYTTIDRRPIVNNHYYPEKQNKNSYPEQDSSDDDSEYEYKVIRVKKS